MMNQPKLITTTIAIVCLALIRGGPAQGPAEFDFDALDQEIVGAEVDSGANTALPFDSAQTEPTQPGVATEVEGSAVVAAIELSDPREPIDLMRAVDQLIRLERPDVAKSYLNRLVTLPLNDVQMANLYEHSGTAVMIRLARASELAPQSRDLALAVMEAGRRALQDPAQLAKWAEQLGADDRSVQYRAAEQLLRAGANAVPALMERLSLATATDDRLLAFGGALFERLADDALDPLYAYLSSEDPKLRATALRAMGRIGSKNSLSHLVGPLFAPVTGALEIRAATDAWQRILGRVPSRDDAISLLVKESDRAYRGQPEISSDPSGKVTCWVWDRVSKRPVARLMRSRDAAAVRAEQLCGDLARLRSSDVDAIERVLVSRLHVAKSLGGLDEPLNRDAGSAFDSTRQLGSKQANEVLRRALHDGHDVAAIGAMEVIGDLADPSVLQRNWPINSADVAPLVGALSHTDRRVRFAAAQAITKLKLAGSFDGAGRLADVLEYFASSRGHRAAVIAHPNRSVAQSIAGILSSRGFRVAAVTNERELLEATTQSADVELIMISDAMNQQSVWSIIEALRVHPKTARLPIAILTRREARDRADRVAEAHARTMVLSETLDDETLDLEMPELLKMAERDAISAERRLGQAQEAVSMLARLVGGAHRAEIDFEARLPRIVLTFGSPELFEGALHVLQQLPSNEAQSVLVDLASENARSLRIRQAAGDAFRESTERFGVRLNNDQVVRQYDRYNESRSLDRETQLLLGSILDSIEEPRQAARTTE